MPKFKAKTETEVWSESFDADDFEHAAQMHSEEIMPYTSHIILVKNSKGEVRQFRATPEQDFHIDEILTRGKADA